MQILDLLFKKGEQTTKGVQLIKHFESCFIGDSKSTANYL